LPGYEGLKTGAVALMDVLAVHQPAHQQYPAAC